MQLRVKAALAALSIALTAGLATAAPAAAVTGGEADGNRHPNVGLILFYSPDGGSAARRPWSRRRSS